LSWLLFSVRYSLDESLKGLERRQAGGLQSLKESGPRLSGGIRIFAMSIGRVVIADGKKSRPDCRVKRRRDCGLAAARLVTHTA
jgi:hypothetical protein